MRAAVVLTLVVTAAAMPAVLALLRRLAVVDHPGDRSSHTTPTLRGGGLAVVLGLLVGLLLAGTLLPQQQPLAGLAAAVISFGLVGLAEDLRGVSPLPRLGLQLLAAAVTAAALLPHLPSGLPGWLPGWLLAVVVVGWLVGYANVFNFMDGINGISASQAIVAGIGYAALGAHLHAVPLEVGGLLAAAAGAGFLPWNFPHARVFLGDTGSYPLGALLAALAVLTLRAGAPIEAAAAPLALYLVDTSVTLVRRIRAGEVWYLPHRAHTYQRLVRLGGTHQQVTALTAALTAVLIGLGAASLTGDVTLRGLADAVGLALLLGYLLLPRLLPQRRGRPVGRETRR